MRRLGKCLIICTGLIASPQGHAHDAQLINLPKLTWEPYFMEEASHDRGYAAEILETCFRPYNIKMIFVDTSLKRSLYQLKDGKLDVWVMSHRKERDQWLEYSREILFYDSYGMFVKKGSNAAPETLEDLSGLRVGTMLGLKVSDGFQDWIARQPANLKPIEALNENALLHRLLEGQIDVAVIGSGAFYAEATKDGRQSEVKLVGQPLRQKGYHMVVSKKSGNIKERSLFIERFDKCLSHLKEETDFIAQLNRKYLF